MIFGKKSTNYLSLLHKTMRESISIILLVLLVGNFLFGQTYLANVAHYGVEEGLSNREVYAIHQDKSGFIWIGTRYGLNRFDSHSFKIYTKEKNGLSSNVLHHILEDDLGNLWLFEVEIWFYNESPVHLSIFNPQSEQAQSFEEYIGDQLPFSLDDISHFIAGHSGELFFNTVQGDLYSFTNKTGFQKIELDSAAFFIPLHHSERNTILGTTERKANAFSSLIEINRQGETLQKFEVPVRGGRLRYIGLEEEEQFWFSSRVDKIGDVLFYIDLKSNSLHQFVDTTKILPPKTSLDWTSRVAFRASDQSFWFKHEPDFIAFHPERGTLFDFTKNLPEIANAQIQAIYFDHKGSAWVGTAFGLYRIELNPNPFKHILSMDYKEYEAIKAYSCRGIQQIDSILYINTYKGRYKIDETNQKISRLPFIPYVNQNGIQTFLAYFPLATFKDRDNNLWFSDYTLIKSNLPSGTEKFYTAQRKDQLDNNIWTIYQDEQERIWLGTEQGICFLNLETESIECLEVDQKFPELSNSFVHTFVKSTHGHIWIGTNSGLYAWSPDKGILTRYWTGANSDFTIAHDNILHIHEDEDQNIWLASGGGGLLQLSLKPGSMKLDTFQQFTIADGLSNNNLYAVYEDQHDQLWMSSDYGIIQFDKKTNRAKAFLPKDGLSHHEFNRISHYKGEDGRLYFGSLNGLTVFHPDEVRRIEESFDIPLRIVQYQQFSKRADQIMDLTSQLKQTRKIVLAPGDQFYNLRFVLLEYINARYNRYRYKLEGLEDIWHHTSENSISLSNLPYGNYELLIQGQGADGRFSSQELKLSIQVLAPVYAQTWFKISVPIFFLVLIFSLYKWRTQSLIKKQLVLEREVRKRTYTIEKQAEELRQVDELKSRFFTNVSHELRTPLSLLLGPIDTAIKRNQLSPFDSDLLKMAKQNGNDLLQLVNEILDLSKLEAKELDLEEKSVQLYEFLRLLITPHESHAQQKNISLVFQYLPDKQLQIDLDAKKLKIILNNLLSNALKFTVAAGKVSIEVLDQGEKILIAVKDTGTGIHPDDLPFVFNRFYQSKKGDFKVGGGTGIGLALSKELAELMKGKLWVESILDQGSTFRFEFPKKNAKIESAQDGQLENRMKEFGNNQALSSQVLTSTENRSEDSTGKPRILLVEDNYSLRSYLKLLLQSDYQVEDRDQGQMALDYLDQLLAQKESLPQLILSDVMMPVMDGFQFLESLKSREEYRSIPVILLTARSTVQDKVTALRIGVDDYITKPFEQEELFARINNLIRNAAMKISINQEEEALIERSAPESFVNRLSNEDALWLEKLEQLVLKHLSDRSFTVDQLSELLFLSKRQVSRKVRKCTGLSPAAYLKEVRLNKARELLETETVVSVKEVAYQVGMSNTDYFGQQFKARFGKLPSTYL